MMESFPSVVVPQSESSLKDNYPVRDDDNGEDKVDKNGCTDIKKDTYRAPCLICGVDLEATFPPPGGVVIKQEVDDVIDQCGDSLNEDDGYLVGGPEALLNESVYLGDKGPITKKEDNSSLYHWFLKLFGLMGEKWDKKRGKRLSKNMKLWGGQGEEGENKIPFCLLCKNELTQLLEFQRKVEELENLIQLGRQGLKEKCGESEVIFERKRVYQNDNRYRTIRQQIISVKPINDFRKPSLSPASRKLKKVPPEPLPPPPSNLEVEDLPVRKSGRRSKTVVKYDPAWFDEDDLPLNTCSVPGAIPMVLLSTSDKVVAERYLPNPVINQNKSSKSKQNRKPSKNKKHFKKSSPALKLDPNTNDLTTYPKGHQDASSFVSVEDNFDLENHDDDNEDDEPPQKTKKRRKPKDEDFIPSDSELHLQNDDDDDISDSEDLLLTPKKYVAKIIHDPIQNTLTFNNITFRQAVPPEDNLYECTSCGVRVVHDSKGKVRYHVIKYHTTLFACSKCDFRGGRPCELKGHVNMVHKRVKRWKYHKTPCEVCGKPVNRSHVKTHLWTHMNKEEKKEATLREEQKEKEGKSFLHFMVKKYQCDECGRRFSIPSTLEKHIKRVHGGDAKDKGEELCPECGMKFVNVQIHMVKKHGKEGEMEKRRFECMEPGCGKRFKDNAQLWLHKDCVHRKLRPWKCNMCTRSFGKKKALDGHVKLHLGIREWKCEECDGMGFARKHHLERHRKTFHEDGCRPRRKGYLRGPTTIGMGWTKGDLVRKGSYYPPSALASWAQGRVPGYLVEEKGGGGGGDRGGGDVGNVNIADIPDEKLDG